MLAVKVLEYSIARRTDLKISVRSMHDLDLPDPKDIRQAKRTGFSFTRFAIPELAGHQGRALYLDADMLVLRDLRELYELPFHAAKVLIQEELSNAPLWGKPGEPKRRIKQCSVMLLDCGALDWDAREVIAGLDGGYTYEELMYDLCILAPGEVGSVIPFEWNSLETFVSGRTGLIHYTDMPTQPWVYAANPNGYLWLNELRAMLADGALDRAEVEEEVRLGYFRPSLLREMSWDPAPGPPNGTELAALKAIDAAAGFIAHAEVLQRQSQRRAAVASYAARRAGGLGFVGASWRALAAVRRRLGPLLRRIAPGRRP